MCIRDSPSTAQNKSALDFSKPIVVTVDQKGYTPASIEIPKNVKEVTLSFTRTTDSTCAREVVFEGQNINKKLPLNEAVEITFNTQAATKITYGCHMDKMYKGVIVTN